MQHDICKRQKYISDFIVCLSAIQFVCNGSADKKKMIEEAQLPVVCMCIVCCVCLFVYWSRTKNGQIKSWITLFAAYSQYIYIFRYLSHVNRLHAYMFGCRSCHYI